MGSPEEYRSDLPPIPKRMRGLPVERGFPVPWFVSKVGDHYDFRVADARKLVRALEEKRCWTCGETLGKTLAFVLGPMCAVSKTTSEPPNHLECAEFSVVACPFLTQKTSEYRETNLPEGITDPAGHAIKRQPGVALIWVTNSYTRFPDGNGGMLYSVGNPIKVSWWSHGRRAMRGEIEQSIGSGLPILFDMAKMDGLKGMRELFRSVETAMLLVP